MNTYTHALNNTGYANSVYVGRKMYAVESGQSVSLSYAMNSCSTTTRSPSTVTACNPPVVLLNSNDSTPLEMVSALS